MPQTITGGYLEMELGHETRLSAAVECTLSSPNLLKVPLRTKITFRMVLPTASNPSSCSA
eukprot:CAMPEP_0172666406 /NCGR_PEP_ID=MMETSP1074-20121228/7781_1 /TAXON_ID=2916 /ORGANISM="Ceratium fusus, Strain PA161109" /LENGTH=59 /DNA_ID=CAMNT_0013482781 /DNA_START=87 /DNA_END=269 /DNA_ORIENTATION=+